MTKPPLDWSSERPELSAPTLRRLLRLAAEPLATVGPTGPEVVRLALTGCDLGRREPLADLLDSTTALRSLRELKERAKRLLAGEHSPGIDAALRLIYHGAIAAALAHHGTNISKQPAGERRRLYAHLASEYDGHPLGEMFASASRALEGRP